MVVVWVLEHRLRLIWHTLIPLTFEYCSLTVSLHAKLSFLTKLRLGHCLTTTIELLIRLLVITVFSVVCKWARSIVVRVVGIELDTHLVMMLMNWMLMMDCI